MPGCVLFGVFRPGSGNVRFSSRFGAGRGDCSRFLVWQPWFLAQEDVMPNFHRAT